MHEITKKSVAFIIIAMMIATPLGVGLISPDGVGSQTENTNDLKSNDDAVVFNSGYLKYRIISESPKEVEIAGCYVYASSYEMPKAVSYNGSEYNVVGIGDHAFSGQIEGNELVIPDNIRYLGEYSLCGCDFESVTIPNSVQTIGKYAFYSSDALKDVLFVEGNNEVKICDYAFSRLGSLDSITLPNCITEICDYAFYACGLKNITFVDGKNDVRIGDHAFDSDYNLKSITFPNCVTEIGDHAFEMCDKLTTVTFIPGNKELKIGNFVFGYYVESVTIPANVTEMGCCAFKYVTECTVDEKNIHYSTDNNHLMYADNGTKLIQFPVSAINQEHKIVLPETVTAINDYVFCDYATFATETLVIGKNIEYIGGMNLIDTFELNEENKNFEHDETNNILYKLDSSSVKVEVVRGCPNRVSITLPETVTSINAGAFKASNTTDIVIPDGVKSLTIGDEAFNTCQLLGTVTFPDEMETLSIGDNVFSGYTEVNDVKFPKAVKTLSIGFMAFDESNMENITFPADVDVLTIGGGAFGGFGGDTITFPANVNKLTIGGGAFQSTTSKVKSISITGVDVTIDDGAFSDWPELKEISITGNHVTIGDKAFDRDYALESADITANSSLEIGESAFSDTALTEFEFPENIDTLKIGDSAFNNTKITSISFPKNTKEIGGYAFDNCKLSSIEFDKDVEGLSIGYGAFSEATANSVSIPKGVSHIEPMAFPPTCNLKVDEENPYYFTDENNVLYTKDGTTLVFCPESAIMADGTFVVPNGVSIIGEAAFSANEKLKKVILSSSVKTVENYAFYGCMELTEVEYKGDVETIGCYAFYECPIKDVIVPGCVKTMGTYAFRSDKTETLTIGTDAKFSPDAFAYFGPPGDLVPGYKYSKNGESFERSKIGYVTVRYDLNGGFGDIPSVVSVSCGSTIILSFDEIPTKDNLRFMGWSLDPNTNVPQFTLDNPELKIENNDVVLYATWSPIAPPDPPQPPEPEPGPAVNDGNVVGYIVLGILIILLAGLVIRYR